jgi:hypothetical protein
MKFKNKFSVCRQDEDTPFRAVLTETALGKKCSMYEKGNCHMDGKKCKTVSYVKERTV